MRICTSCSGNPGAQAIRFWVIRLSTQYSSSIRHLVQVVSSSVLNQPGFFYNYRMRLSKFFFLGTQLPVASRRRDFGRKSLSA